MAEWDTAYINDLPDSAFAYIEPGGEKDDEGKTKPRSLRHFPHHDADGKLDKAHVDDAAGRIPTSDVSAEGKSQAEAHIEKHQKALGEDVESNSRRPGDVERRFVRSQITSDGDGMHYTGYAARFNERTYIGPPKQGFYEVVAPGAFKRALKDSDVQMLFNHEPNMLLGRTGSGTVRLSEDNEGLWTDADLPNTQLGRDISVLVQRRDIAGMSFSFLPVQDRWETLPGGHAQLRTLLDVDLFDVSPVTNPAYNTTTASVRAHARMANLELRGGASKERRAGVINYGLVAMCQAADAGIDAAALALAAGNPAQACALLSGASLSIEEASWQVWWLDPQLLSALGAENLPNLIAAVDTAVDNAYTACAQGASDASVLEAALSASDALLASLHVPDADKDDDERQRKDQTELRRRWMNAAQVLITP